MTTFTFDTSGHVEIRDPHPHHGVYAWTDLSPFVQGAMIAASEEASGTCATCQGNGEVVTDWDVYLKPPEGAEADAGTATCPTCDGKGEITIAFSDWSPEALAPILRDCERFKTEGYGWADDDATDGVLLWRTRQAGDWADVGFPPLLITLNDEGKVCLSPTGGGR